MHLSQITPSIFSSLGLESAVDHLGIGISPNGRELLFLIDGFGINTFSQYAEVMPTMSRMFNHGLIQTAFPSTTATSLATLTTGELPGAQGLLGYTVQVPRSGGRLLNCSLSGRPPFTQRTSHLKTHKKRVLRVAKH